MTAMSMDESIVIELQVAGPRAAFTALQTPLPAALGGRFVTLATVDRSAAPFLTPKRFSSGALVLVAHVLFIYVFFLYAPLREVIHQALPMSVTILQDEQPKVDLPKPLPTKIKPLDMPPVMESAPTPLVVIEHTQSNFVVAVPVVQPTMPSYAPPAPASTTPPKFDADYLDNPAPIYPPLSRRANEEGTVLLRVFVEANGLPSQIEIKTSSRSTRLDNAAIEAVKRWKFVAARQGDKTVAAWVLVPIAFSLRDK